MTNNIKNELYGVLKFFKSFVTILLIVLNYSTVDSRIFLSIKNLFVEENEIFY